MLFKILTLLQEILKTLNELRTILLELKAVANVSEKDELLDNSDAKRFLKIGDSTLYRWRKRKLINSRLIGGKHYYLKSALNKLLEGCTQENSSVK